MRVFLKASLVAALLFCASGLSFAQSAAEIAAAKSVAKAYGYSEKEINDVLNHNISGVATNVPVAKTAKTTANTIGKVPTTVIPGTDAPTIEQPETPAVLTPAAAALPADAPTAIYGHSYFKSQGLSNVPSYNAPAPASYVLGPGDELVIDIWGASTSHIVAEIGKDGAISVYDMGPIYLTGQTLKAAERILKNRFSRLYSGLDNGMGGDTYLKLSIGKIKGVVVNVLGEVATPGAYNVPSLSTLTSVIFMAGGVTDRGTVRNITLYRGSKKVTTFDLYKFIFDGVLDPNVRIQDGDIISVEPYKNVVSIAGAVARAQRYELKDGESIDDVIKYAGGFTTAAQREQVNVVRRNSQNGEAFDVPSDSFKTFELKDGDAISVRSNPDLYTNRVSISGPVVNPGAYAISENLKDVKALILAAGGLIEGAYTGHGQIKRLDENRLPVSLNFDVEKVLAGEEVVELVREDAVSLFTQKELKETFTITVSGYVNAPGTFQFSEGMTLADAILFAKGVKEDAFLSRGQINRLDHQGAQQIVPFNVEDVLNGTANLPLVRNDNIRIFAIREFVEDATITINGEVNNPTTVPYREGITLQDLIMIGGGLTNAVDLTNVEVASRGGRERGSVATYNLDENPEARTLVLKPYDVVSFRRLTYFRGQKTVAVLGEVMTPGTYVVDKPEVRLSDIIAKTGGFTDEAYVHGARLLRQLTEEEMKMQDIASLIATQFSADDTVQVQALQNNYLIAIQLDKALSHPGGEYDVILRAGDVISVPCMNNTVRVSGAVNYPNVLTYQKGETWRQYVKRSGGFTRDAKICKSYVIYMNGNVDTARGGMKVEPGSEIIVPLRVKDREKVSIGELAAVTSSTTALATLVTTIFAVLR